MRALDALAKFVPGVAKLEKWADERVAVDPDFADIWNPIKAELELDVDPDHLVAKAAEIKAEIVELTKGHVAPEDHASDDF